MQHSQITSMVSRNLVLVIALLASASYVLADPDPLQDFCVAAPESNVFGNGIACKDPKLVTFNDFVFSAKMNQAGDTSNPFGVAANSATVNTFPGLNTLGVSLIRVDYASGKGTTPHLHPRASELLVFMEGTSLLAGFVTPDNKLFSGYLKPGDVFVFPKGVVHFQYNIGSTPAYTLSAFGSQNPGLVAVGSVIFGSPIHDDIPQNASKGNRTVIDQLQALFGNQTAN